MNKPRSIENATCPDLRGSWPALQRAAIRAREIAAETGTAIVVVRNGRLEHEYPHPMQTTNISQEEPPAYGKPA